MAGRSFRRGLFAAALIAPAMPLTAAPKSASSTSKVTLLRPLALLKTQDLDFGYLAVTTAGTAVIDPTTNTESVTGGVTTVGGTPEAAMFSGAASKNSVVNISLPNKPVTLTLVGGTQTMTVSNFTLNGPTKKQMAQSTSFQFSVGATLNVAAGQTEGPYVGTFTVTAQYP